MRALALALALAGCYGPQGDPTPLPRQAEAVQLVWSALGQTKAPPPVYWRRDKCYVPNGVYGVWPTCQFDSGNAGVFLPYFVEVGAPIPGYSIKDTALAHELLHAAIGDPGHTSIEWSTTLPAIERELLDDGY